MHQAATRLQRAIRLRIQVTGLDAMCRMIANGLGVGVMPLRAFGLMHAGDTLQAIELSDAWAHRSLSLVARDFDTLPVTARMLVEHLRERPPPPPTHAPS
jgi:DNA-binding transcriptional LysR family regulator